MHWEILDDERKAVVPHLGFLKEEGFYLAGGTALALHLGHRRSVDFDFYSPQPFEEMILEQNLVGRLKDLRVTHRGAGTLIAQYRAVDLSFFHYGYPLLEPPAEADPLRLASVPDIASMKLIAITQRGLL